MMHLCRIAVVCVASCALASHAAAQDAALGGCDPDGPTPPFLSAASEVYYGCGWLFRSKPPQVFLAISRFRAALATEPDNAVARYLLGAAHAAYDQPDSARAALSAAMKLDPSVEQKLAARLAEAPGLRRQVDVVLGRAAAAPAPREAAPTAPVAPAAPRPPTVGEQGRRPGAGRAAFRVGEAVDVRTFEGADWKRGTVIQVNDVAGDGSFHTYRVRIQSVTGPVEETFYPGNIRARTAATDAATTVASSKPGGQLALGSYACWHHTWTGAGAARQRSSRPVGSVTLLPRGAYRWLDNGGTGRFRYTAATGEIVWLSGPMAEKQPEKTTFERHGKAAGIDIQLKGVYRWSCGKDLP